MRIDKEEKRSLKKLFVGILVMALLVTMMPFENIGKIVAKAEGATVIEEEKTTSSLQSTAPFNADTPVIWVESYVLEGNSGTVSAAQVFREKLSEIAEAMQNKAQNPYPNGVILKLGESVDLEEASIILPSGYVGIDMGDYSIKSIGMLEVQKTEPLEMTEEYGTNLFVLGTDKNSFEFEGIVEVIEGDAGTIEETIPKDLYLSEGTQFVFTNVDVQNAVITAGQGSAFGYNDFYYEVPILTEDSLEEIKVIYDSKMGAGVYRMSTKLEGDMPAAIYVDDLYIKDDIETFDVITSAMDSYSTYIYTEEAVANIPVDVTLTYRNECFVAEYPNPGIEFIIDENGMYSLSADKRTATVYAMNYGLAYFHSFDGTDKGAILINGNVEVVVENEDGTYYEPCTKVIFAEGWIPETYTCNCDLNNHVFTEIYLGKAECADQMEYEFNLTNRATIPVFNDSFVPATVIDADTAEADISKLWIRCPQLEGTLSEDMILENVSINGGSYSSGGFIESGTKIKVIPKIENGTIYNAVFERLGIYEIENIAYNVDGSLEVTVPNYACDFYANVGTIDETTSYSVVDDNNEGYSEVVDGVTIYVYKNNFVVRPEEGFLIFDTTGNETNWSDKVIVSQQGDKVEKTFYVLNQKGEPDPYSTEVSYGKISKFTYTYTLDTATPTITSVTANTKEDSITLKDGWQASTVDTVWISEPSVTLEATATAGDGLPVAGYKFGSASWQTENTYTISGEGVHDIEIHARDEFDVKLENAGKSARAESGVWKVSIGIDTTAPILLFTDANNSNLTELKSNGVYEGNLYFTFSESGSGLGNFIVYEKDGEEWISNSENLVSTADGIYIKPVETDMTYRIQITDVAGNETIYDNILVKAPAQEVVPVPPEADPMPPTVEPIPPTVEPEQPADKPVPPTEEPEDKLVPPVAVGNGRVSLISGTAYSLGEGTWKVSGDSTNYAGGITFYVSENGEYDFSQQ